MTDPRDTLCEVASRLCGAQDWTTGPSARLLKRLLVIAWANMDKADRLTFMAHLNDDIEFVPPERTSDDLRLDMAVTHALQHWDEVIPGLEGATRGFAIETNKRRHWKNWKATKKQAAWILQIWRDHIQTAGMSGDVIESEAQ